MKIPHIHIKTEGHPGQTEKKRLILTLAFCVPLAYLTMSTVVPLIQHVSLSDLEYQVFLAILQCALAIPVIILNRKYFMNGFGAMLRKKPNADSLIAISASASLVYGLYSLIQVLYGMYQNNLEYVLRYSLSLYFLALSMVLLFVSLGKYIEARMSSQSSKAMLKLRCLRPDSALVLQGNTECTVQLDDILPGFIIIVQPGQKIPVDGIVIEGKTTIDVSAITGNSVPVEKKPGDRVTSGSVNKSGRFTFRADRVGRDATIERIIRLSDEEIARKKQYIALSDKISALFVPSLVIVATLTASVWLIAGATVEFALSCGMSILIVACPCALALAAPLSTLTASIVAKKNGLDVHVLHSLEKAHKIDTVVLDTAGVITSEKPKVTDILSVSDLDHNELLAIAASLEKFSEHPLAFAIMGEALQSGIHLLQVENFIPHPGKGIEGTINGKKYYAGGPELLEENGINPEKLVGHVNSLAATGKVPFCFGGDGLPLGIIAVAEVIKTGAKEAIAEITSMGIETIILTGANPQTAEGIREKTGISRTLSELMPDGKALAIRQLRAEGKTVAMIGDGINNAPALFASDICIVPGNGSDITVDSADIILIRNDLRDVVTLFQLRKVVKKNIKENFFWAFAYNMLCLPVAAGAFYPLFGILLNPMLAAAAMALSLLSVILNSLRIHFFRRSNIMTKTLKIEGMSCSHCVGRVEKALNAIDGVRAKVDLAKKTATIVSSDEISDAVLEAAVVDAGYTVTK